jgi:hypothetical protein
MLELPDSRVNCLCPGTQSKPPGAAAKKWTEKKVLGIKINFFSVFVKKSVDFLE